jgi:hypothetical protein
MSSRWRRSTSPVTSSERPLGVVLDVVDAGAIGVFSVVWSVARTAAARARRRRLTRRRCRFWRVSPRVAANTECDALFAGALRLRTSSLWGVVSLVAIGGASALARDQRGRNAVVYAFSQLGASVVDGRPLTAVRRAAERPLGVVLGIVDAGAIGAFSVVWSIARTVAAGEHQHRLSRGRS